jgi:hypothetical protein
MGVPILKRLYGKILIWTTVRSILFLISEYWLGVSGALTTTRATAWVT